VLSELPLLMHKVRTPVLIATQCAVLGIAAWSAAADYSSTSLGDAGIFNSAPIDEVLSSSGSSNQTDGLLQLSVEANDNPSIVSDQESLNFNEPTVPSSIGESPPLFGSTNDEDAADLIGLRPPNYGFGYNRVRSATTWLPGDDDRFGWFSYESLGETKINDGPALVTGFGFHFLDGPVQTDMPPRLFDFSIGLADRRRIEPNIGYDILFRVGAFSDFEGSARDGVRFPSHAVTFFRLNPSSELVLVIDYLDWDDLRLLPVVGSIWSPTDWIRIEAVFPRPRVATRIDNTSTWLYVGGELGGGTWAIERDNLFDDNATYRDLRLVLGWETLLADKLRSSFEIGYVFDRELSYSSGIGDFDPKDGFMVRMGARY